MQHPTSLCTFTLDAFFTAMNFIHKNLFMVYQMSNDQIIYKKGDRSLDNIVIMKIKI